MLEPKAKNRQIIGYTVIILIITTISYQPIKEHFIEKCQDRFGKQYNIQREKLSIPIIPVGWHIKQRDKNYIYWCENEVGVGHMSKTVSFTDCLQYGELDLYRLPKQNGQKRWIDIEHDYKQKPSPDSIVYTYQIEHTAKEISKRLSDSIFNAEHIVKDYN